MVRKPEKKKNKKDIEKINKKYDKMQKEIPPSLLRANKRIKHGMELLDDTFGFLKQRPPAMHVYTDDPSSRFMIEVYALVAKWPEGVLKQFITELTNLEPPKDVSGMIGIVKRIIHEVFGDTGVTSGETYLARWRMWPHRREKAEEKVREKTNQEGKENMMASKMAVKKKVASVKKGDVEKKTKKAKSNGDRAGALNDASVLTRKKAETKESALWTKFLGEMGAKDVSFAALCKTMKTKLKMDEKKVRRITLSLRRRGLVELKAE